MWRIAGLRNLYRIRLVRMILPNEQNCYKLCKISNFLLHYC